MDGSVRRCSGCAGARKATSLKSSGSWRKRSGDGNKAKTLSPTPSTLDASESPDSKGARSNRQWDDCSVRVTQCQPASVLCIFAFAPTLGSCLPCFIQLPCVCVRSHAQSVGMRWSIAREPAHIMSHFQRRPRKCLGGTNQNKLFEASVWSEYMCSVELNRTMEFLINLSATVHTRLDCYS